MTIEELYQWAKSQGVENYTIGILKNYYEDWYTTTNTQVEIETDDDNNEIVIIRSK